VAKLPWRDTDSAYFLVLLTKTMQDEEQYPKIGIWTPSLAKGSEKLMDHSIPWKYISRLPRRRISLV
jgi:hypothetical protein